MAGRAANFLLSGIPPRPTSDGTDTDGKPIKGGYVSKFDGKDVPWAGNPMADVASPKKLDDNSYENVWKKDGKAVVTAKVAVSKDGKTLTVSQSGTDEKGAAFSSRRRLRQAVDGRMTGSSGADHRAGGPYAVDTLRLEIPSCLLRTAFRARSGHAGTRAEIECGVASEEELP